MAGLKNLKKTRRIQVIALAGTSVVAILGVLWFLPEDSFQFFRSPSEVVAAPPPETELFRIGGLVEEGSIVRGQGETVQFRVTDGGATVPVVYTGILPDLFAENQGMVGQGRYVDGTFEAVEILARHDETYMPREVIDALEAQGYYKPTEAADGALPVN